MRIFLAFLLCLAICGLLFFLYRWNSSEPTLPSYVTLIGKLPTLINESSGIELGDHQTYWTFNDSGGEAEIYQVDHQGKLIMTIDLVNAWNRDWEDIARDIDGNLYISNLGNNNNKNTDLTLFKIPNPDRSSDRHLHADTLSIAFEDQSEFPPPKDEMNFDCEAVFWFHHHLYLSTKHRSLPMASHLYKIPDSAGHYIARKIDSIALGPVKKGEDPITDYWITAGDISPEGNRVALLSGNKLWLFYDFSEDRFFSGQQIMIPLGHSTQKEALVFLDSNTLILTDERWAHKNIGGNLYRVDLKKALQTVNCN